jgi:4-hydroxymandelate oxidase
MRAEARRASASSVDWTDPEAVEEAAARVLHPAVRDYFAGGAGAESTLEASGYAWDRWQLHPRVLHDISTVDTATTLLGERLAAPIVVAPMGYQRLAHPDGELATARACAGVGLSFALSTYATTSLEEVAACAEGPRWFQAYVLRDRAITVDMLQRAASSGCSAVLLTVDAPVVGDRRRDRRHGYWLPTSDLRLANFPAHSQQLTASYSTALDAGLTADDVAWVAEVSGLPVLVKGVLRADDAVRCVDAGAAGVVVSNHGGRQLDGAVPSATALPEVADAVGGRATVLVDGRVRTGTEVLRAVALGADAILVGRRVLWALAAGGAPGVAAVLEHLVADLGRAMALCGVARLDDLPAGLVRAAGAACRTTEEEQRCLRAR